MTDRFVGILDPSSSGDSTGQTGPDTLSTVRNTDILTFAGPSNADPTKSASSSSQKVYVLTYDAALWAHEDTTESITLLNGQPILVSWSEDRVTTQRFTLTYKGSPRLSWSKDSLKRIQPCGTLGVYLTEAKAKRVGKQWLYDQLLRLGAYIEMPLQLQDGSECEEPVWKKSGWRRTANGIWAYSISDYSPRKLLLVVHVSERTVDESDSEEEHEDSDDNAEEPTYVLVGPPGSRKRVRANPQKKQKKSGGQVGAEGQDTDGGDDAAGGREDESREAEDGIQDMDPREFIGPRGWSDTGIRGMHPDMLIGPPGPRTRG